jgi:hypothetical protein
MLTGERGMAWHDFSADLNAELVRKQMEGFKLGAGSSKATLKKAPMNITQEVRAEEKRRQAEHKGKSGEAAVSSRNLRLLLVLLTCPSFFSGSHV